MEVRKITDLPRNLEPESALIIVGVQVDFCPGGALAVHQGDRVVPVLNEWIEIFLAEARPIAYTQDK